MKEKPGRPNWQDRLESHFESDSGAVAGFVVLLGFLLRLWRTSGTFLNPDEAMHFLAAIASRWRTPIAQASTWPIPRC
jgi:hypothetical protein